MTDGAKGMPNLDQIAKRVQELEQIRDQKIVAIDAATRKKKEEAAAVLQAEIDAKAAELKALKDAKPGKLSATKKEIEEEARALRQEAKRAYNAALNAWNRVIKANKASGDLEKVPVPAPEGAGTLPEGNPAPADLATADPAPATAGEPTRETVA